MKVEYIIMTPKRKINIKYRHPFSPRIQKAKTQPSTGKCTWTVFYNNKNVIYQKYMEK